MSGTHTQQPNPLFATMASDNSTTLRLSADLVRPASREVRDALLDLLAARPKRLLVDLTQVQTLDEAGLGTLLVVALWARKFSVEFALIPSQTTRSRLTTARLDGYLTLVEH
jgi:anti-anti-sigma regulatory factor